MVVGMRYEAHWIWTVVIISDVVVVKTKKIVK